MKIYIENFNLNIINDIEKNIKNNLIKSKSFINVYTNEGIFIINEKEIYILESIDKEVKIIKNYYDNFNLIIDNSYFNKSLVESIYGNIHINKSITKNYYKFNQLSKLTLVIENENNVNNLLAKPIDIYFKCDENININDIYIKQEIIEFLYALN
jgi:hypothetical protein